MTNFIAEKQKDNLNLEEVLQEVKIELNTLENKLISETAGNNDFLNNAIKPILSSNAKYLRPAICFLVAKTFNNGIVSSNHFQVGLALELIHTATLIHDDIIDEATKRRGVETIHKKYSDKVAVLAGDYLLAKALNKLANVNNNKVVELFANIMSQICEGEIQQGQLNYTNCTLEKYIQKSKQKTAMLFAAAAKSAAIITPNINNEELQAISDYALNLGIAFQIADDILPFYSNETITGKSLKIDFKNGVITAPIIFALESSKKQNDDKLLNNLIKFQQNGDEKTYNEIIDNINKCKAIIKTNELILNYADKAIKSLNSIKESNYKQSLIKLVRFATNRTY